MSDTPRTEAVVKAVPLRGDSFIGDLTERQERLYLAACDMERELAAMKIERASLQRRLAIDEERIDSLSSSRAMAFRQNEGLRAALSDLVEHYVSLINSGDAGNWDPEKEPQVIAARSALAKRVPT